MGDPVFDFSNARKKYGTATPPQIAPPETKELNPFEGARNKYTKMYSKPALPTIEDLDNQIASIEQRQNTLTESFSSPLQDERQLLSAVTSENSRYYSDDQPIRQKAWRRSVEKANRDGKITIPKTKDEALARIAEIDKEDANLKKDYDKQYGSLEYAKEFLTDARRILEAPEKGVDTKGLSNLWQGAKGQVWKDWASLGMNELVRTFDVLRIAKKGDKDPGSLTSEEKNLLEMYRLFDAIEQGKELPSGYKIGHSVVEMIPYMAEFALTGGTSATVKEGVRAGLKTGAKKTAKNLVKRAIGYTAGAAVQSQFMPMQYQDFADRRIDQFEINGSGDDLSVALSDNAESVFKSGYKGFMTGLMETWSEGIGDIMSKSVGKVGIDMAKRYGLKEGAQGLLGLVGKVQRATKWDGPIWEYVEENVNNVGQALLTGDRQLKDLFSKEEQFELFMTTMIMGQAFRVAELPGQAQVYDTRRKYDSADKKFQETIPANVGFQVLEALNGKSLNDMREIMANVEFERLDGEQQKTVFDYITSRLRYDMVVGGIEGEIEQKAQGMREKETGQIVAAEDKEGNQWLINERVGEGSVVATNAITGEKKMISEETLVDVSSIPFEQYMAEQTDVTFSELFDQGKVEFEQTVADANLEQSPVQVGDPFQYNGVNYIANEIGQDGSVFGIPADETVKDPVSIPANQVSNIKPLNEQGQETDDQPKRTVKVGDSQYDMIDNGDGSFIIDQSFTDKEVASRVRDQLEDQYEGRGFEVVMESQPTDPNDILSPSTYSVRLNTGQTSQVETQGEQVNADEASSQAQTEGQKVENQQKADTGSGQAINQEQEKSGADTGGGASAQAASVDKNAEVEAAEKEVNTNPTEGQKEAGNYKKGHVSVQGMDISIENPKGSKRSGVDNNGKKWSVKMNNSYGYIKRTEGQDGDQVDVFLGDNLESDKVYVVAQKDPSTGKFDEHKVMLGFNSQEEAEKAYLSNYQRGWKGMGPVAEMSVDGFKQWLKDGTLESAQTKPQKSEKLRSESKSDIKKGEITYKWVNQQTAKITKGWNIPGVNVVKYQEFLPKDILEAADGSIVTGVYVGDRGVYVVAENITGNSTQEAAAKLKDTLVHESIGHYGVRAVMGNNTSYKKVMANLAKDRWEDMKAAGLLEMYGANENLKENSEEKLYELGEEYVAHLAETNPTDKGLLKVIAWIRTQLRKIAPGVKMNDNDIAYALQKARKHVIKGGVNKTRANLRSEAKAKIRLKVDAWAKSVKASEEDLRVLNRAIESGNTPYSGPHGAELLEIHGLDLIPLSELRFKRKEDTWDRPNYHSPAFGTVNNRLSKEVEMFDRLFGSLEDAHMVPGKLEGSQRPDTRSASPQALFDGMYDMVTNNREYVERLFDKSVDPKAIAKERGVSDADLRNFVMDVNALRVEGDVLSDNGKAGRSLDFLLATCQPTAPCAECYAASAYIRMSNVRKHYRNTLKMLLDPVAFGKAVAEETKQIPKEKMPFVRLQGSGDLTTDEQVDAYNELARNADRPIQIFSRHHDMLGRLESTPNAPFIKMGSIDAQLYEEYGHDFLEKNLEERGISNAWMLTHESEIPEIKRLYEKGSIGLVLAVEASLHEQLPEELKMAGCPCDASERTYYGSCRRCALSNLGCFMAFSDKGVDGQGKIWNIMDTNAPSDLLPLTAFVAPEQQAKAKGNVAADIARKSVELVNLYYGQFKKGEKDSVPLKDLRFDNEEGNAAAFRSSDPKEIEAYIGNLKLIQKNAKEGTFVLPGGKLQPSEVYEKGSKVQGEEAEKKVESAKKEVSRKSDKPIGEVFAGEVVKNKKKIANLQANEQQETYTKDGSKIVFSSLRGADNNSSASGNVRKKIANRETNPSLRKLGEGEFSRVERKYSLDKNFSFTGKEKIESIDDVAYIFKQLETASVENMFAVYVQEDGNTIVQHVSMGDATGTVINFQAFADGIGRFNPKKVYMVHNHPSGNLVPSGPDRTILKRLRDYYGDLIAPGLIINIDSGKYGMFEGENVESEADMPSKPDKVKDYKVLKFDRSVFNKDVGFDDPKHTQMRGADDVAQYISAQRLSNGNKMSVLVMTNSNRVVANIHLPYTNITDDPVKLTQDLNRYVSRFGGKNAILYGRGLTAHSTFHTMTEVLKNQNINLLDMVEIHDWEGGGISGNSLAEPEAKFAGSALKEKTAEPARFKKEDTQRMKDLLAESNKPGVSPARMLEIEDELMKMYFGEGELGTVESQKEEHRKQRERNDAIEATMNAPRVVKLDGATTIEYTKAVAPDQEENDRRMYERHGIIPAGKNVRFKKADTFFMNSVAAAAQVPFEKNTAQKWKDQLLSRGAKKAELDWMGWDEAFKPGESITRDQVNQFLKDNHIQLEEVIRQSNRTDWSKEEAAAMEMFGRPLNELNMDEVHQVWDAVPSTEADEQAELLDGITPMAPKYMDYTLPGGREYHELVMTIPRKTRERSVSVHEIGKTGRFILVDDNTGKQISSKEYTDKTEAQVTALAKSSTPEPIDDAYSTNHWEESNIVAHTRFNTRTGSNGEKILHVEEIQSDWAQEGKKRGFKAKEKLAYQNYLNSLEAKYGMVWKQNDITVAESKELDRLREAAQKAGRGTVPDMPFKETKEWVGLVVKRALRWAAENGFDTVTWTTGQQQADRYDLSKKIDKITYSHNEDGTINVVAISTEDVVGDPVIYKEHDQTPEQLEGVFGKEIVQKMINNEGQTREKFAFQAGEVQRDLREDDLRIGGSGMKAFYDQIVPSYVKKYVKKYGAKVEMAEIPSELEFGNVNSVDAAFDSAFRNKHTQVHSVKLTPELKKMASQPQPMFKKAAPINSQAFRSWFRNSRITNEDGTPKVMYHGTNRDFNEFRSTSRAIFFSESPKFAADYAKGHDGIGWKDNGSIMPVFIRSENPFDYANEKHVSMLMDRLRKDYPHSSEEYFTKLEERIKSGKWNAIEMWEDQIVALKFDGMYLEEWGSGGDTRNLAVFSGRQVKSAIGNNGRYDTRTSDVRWKKKSKFAGDALKSDKEEKNPIRMTRSDRFAEAIQDRMITVKKWQDEIARRGGIVDDFSDPYGQENLSHSRVMNGIKEFDTRYMDPIKKTVADLITKHQLELPEIQRYLKAKHAIERNNALMEKTGRENNSGFETKEAQAIATEFEAKVGQEAVKGLWSDIRGATDQTLDHWLHDGYISKDTYQRIKGSYNFYVPLRGWKETGLEDLYGYQTGVHKGEISMNKKAEGRTTESEDPLQYIANMAYSAIIAGEKNRVKMHAARLIMQNRGMTDLHRINKVYSVFSGQLDEEGKEIWIDQLEKPSQEQWDQGIVKTRLDPATQSRRPLPELKQHDVSVMISGERYVMSFPESNPIAPGIANAINKENNFAPELTAGLMNSIGRVTRVLSANFTSKNPAFFIVNQMRDLSYATLSHWVRGDSKSAGRFMKSLPASRKAIIRSLKGEVDPNNEMDKMYQDFMLQGGETGYIHLQQIDQITSDMEKEIRRLSKSKNVAGKAWEAVWIKGGEVLEHYAVRSENLARFATYVTAIKEGKSKREAAKAAKDVTVNFNRKGRMSGLFGSVYAFFNAALQGGANIVSMYKKNPKKFLMINAGMMALGTLSAMMAALWAGDDDEDGTNDYEQLNDYLKYNYLVLPVPGSKRFITLPMPHGFKAFYSFGVLAFQGARGEKELGQALKSGVANIFDSMSPVNPVDIIDNEGKFSFRPFIPTAAIPVHDIIVNQNFAGQSIYRKPYTVAQEGRLADSSLGMRNVNQWLKKFTDTLYKIGGGDPEIGSKAKYNPDGSIKINEKGEVEMVGDWADWNPSKMEYVIEYFLGGRGKFWNNVVKTGSGIVEGAYRTTTGKEDVRTALKEFEVNDAPVVRRLVRQPWGNGIMDEFYRISDEMNTYKQAKTMRKQKYGEDFESFGDIKTERAVELYDYYMEDLNDLKEELNDASNDRVVEMIKQQREMLMKKFVEHYNRLYAQNK